MDSIPDEQTNPLIASSIPSCLGVTFRGDGAEVEFLNDLPRPDIKRTLKINRIRPS